MKQHYYIPIRIVSEANKMEHWSKKHKRKKAHRAAINAICRNDIESNTILPVTIRLTRIAPRAFDFDNLCSSLKAATDIICDLILPGLAPGRADGDKRIKKIEYFQERGDKKEYGLKIEIFGVSESSRKEI